MNELTVFRKESGRGPEDEDPFTYLASNESIISICTWHTHITPVPSYSWWTYTLTGHLLTQAKWTVTG